MTVPSDYSTLQTELLERDLTDATWYCPPQHLSYFSYDSLVALLEATGFEVEVRMADFPIEVFLFNEHSNYAKIRQRGRAAHDTRVAVDNRNLSTTMGHSTGLIREQCPVW